MPPQATFLLTISYRQIAVFDATLDEPFNDWQPQHIQQGFAWRPGSVSFSTLLDTGEVDIHINIGAVDVDEPSECLIEVPFTVPEHGQLSVASIMDEQELELQPGDYQLVYNASGHRVSLSFVPSGEHAFRIHKQDDAAKSLTVLSTQAQPAE